MLGFGKQEEIIISLLVDYKQLSTKSLYDEYCTICSRAEKISLSQFYKVVSNMKENHILTKEHGLLSLNTLWIEKMIVFVNKLNSYKKLQSLKLPENEGKSIRVYADSLKELDSIWVELYATVIKKTNPEKAYFYDSHLYFLFGSSGTELSYYMFNKEKGIYVLQMVGNNCFLDRYGSKLIKDLVGRVGWYDTKLLPNRGYYVAVLGSYIFDVYIPDIILDAVHTYYTGVSCIEDFDKDLFTGLFSMKTKCFMTVRYDSDEAMKIMEEISVIEKKE